MLEGIGCEHVTALSEVLDREQVVAFGLNVVLHETEGRGVVEEREVDVDGDVYDCMNTGMAWRSNWAAMNLMLLK